MMMMRGWWESVSYLKEGKHRVGGPRVVEV
jgi:hypothetical protein